MLLNHAEATGQWPDQLRVVRTAYLAKTSMHSADPLQYRGLLVMSALYRVWGKLRLHDLRAWTEKWQDPVLHAGVPGVGAQDAWYAVSCQVEAALASGRPVAGTALDIFKCFDQINRWVCYTILLRSGCPQGIIRAYMAYMETLKIIPVYGVGVGQIEERPCGIPQGCPLSMLIVARLMVILEGHNGGHRPRGPSSCLG